MYVYIRREGERETYVYTYIYIYIYIYTCLQYYTRRAYYYEFMRPQLCTHV